MKSKKLPPAVFQSSRRLKRPRSEDRDGIRSLLNRLQRIVPEAPKDRQLPEVQVIQHVIDYICQLQHQVVQHPRFGKMQIPPEIADALSEAGVPQPQLQQLSQPQSQPQLSQPQPQPQPPQQQSSTQQSGPSRTSPPPPAARQPPS